jgi:hypothetical protein
MRIPTGSPNFKQRFAKLPTRFIWLWLVVLCAGVGGAVVFDSPLGLRWKICACLAIWLGTVILLVRLASGLNEQAIMDATDELLKANDDEDHKQFGI